MVFRMLPQADIAADVLIPVLNQIRAELQIPLNFPDEVIAQANRATRQWASYLDRLRTAQATAHHDADPGDWEVFNELPITDTTGLDALHAPALPSLDATHIPFVTIDPPGSRDLDQAVHLAQLNPSTSADGAAYLVNYAIASLATFVPPNTPLDAETRNRGLTTYLPDQSAPLHPVDLSEGSASLLPGQTCPAYVWQIRLDTNGKRLSWRVRRALIRSRAQLTYQQVQDWVYRLDAPKPQTPTPPAQGADMPAAVPGDLPVLLREIGQLRIAREASRGGVSSRVPEQEVVSSMQQDEQRYHLVYRSGLPTEEWNAQISLLTGMCAASLMRDLGIGVLRTVPPASAASLERMRRVARALQVEWPKNMSYADLIRSLDIGQARNAAFVLEATSLFRGAGYTVFGVPGTETYPDQGADESRHAPIAAEYAHTTAPLRRLVDRWSLELCLAASAGTPIPAWVLDSLASLPELMGEATRRVSAAEKESLSAVEALLLAGRVGEVFFGAIVDVDRPGGGSKTWRAANGDSDQGIVMVAEPAVMAKVRATGADKQLELGADVQVRLVSAEVTRRWIEFAWPV